MIKVTVINTAWLSIPACETQNDEGLRAKGLDANTRIRIPVLVYAVETDGGNYLIDTGTDNRIPLADRLRYRPELTPALDRYAAGKTFDTIALTHSDFDHCGNLERLTWKQFVIREEEWQTLPARAKKLLSRREPPRLLENSEFLEGRFPFLSVDLTGGGKFFALDMPGHSAGHTGYLFANDNFRLLFSGDACESSDGLKFPAAYAADDPEAYIETVETLREWLDSDPGLVLLTSHDSEIAGEPDIRVIVSNGKLFI